MRQWIMKKSETLFSVLFVMMEGLELEFRELAWRKTCVLFIIDFLQLLRILTLPVFGWSEATSGLIEKFDLVYDFTLLGSMVVPRYSFFILAFLVITSSLAITAYVARIFEQGSVKQMWPVRLLRFIVVITVTTLFSSLVKWLLIPFSCLVSDEDSFSVEIHGAGTTCNPFRFPEILATVPTVLVAATYVTFAFIVTAFSMQVNVLSRAPRSSSTGRVELLFLATKVAATCLTLITHLVSPTAVAALLLVVASAVFWLHASTLPFHHHPTNVLRGGIYGASAWAALASTVVSVNDTASLQWTLIALLPVSFLFGMLVVHRSRATLLAAVDRLRGEWEQRLSLNGRHKLSSGGSSHGPHSGYNGGYKPKTSSNGNASPAASGSGPACEDEEAFSGVGSRFGPSVGVDKRPSAMERFYDTDGERRRIFVSARHALSCARMLLYKRRAGDRAFLEYIIDRGIEDFRNDQQLEVFRILVLSMVSERSVDAKAKEKKLREESHESMPMDLRYLLFCFERKATQDKAAYNLGKQGGGQISALLLMEFNLGLTKAKKAHQKAIQALRSCWRLVYRLSKGHARAEKMKNLAAEGEASQSNPGRATAVGSGTYSEVVSLLERFQGHVAEARREYGSLMFKFPSSVELLFSYAAFVDVCLNDARESDARLRQARALQDGDEERAEHSVAGDERRWGGGGNEDARSAASGSTTDQDRRKVTQRFVASWQSQVMGAESAELARLQFRVKAATLLLVLTATAAFILSDFVLFKGMTNQKMHRITSLGNLYTVAVSLCFHTRSLFLGAHNSPLAADAVRQHGFEMVAEMQSLQVTVHQDMDFAAAQEFYNARHFNTLVPTAGGWMQDKATLWEVGNEYTARTQLAYATPDAELRNASFDLRHISDNKRNIPYVVENAFHLIVPTLEDLKGLYVHEMEVIQHVVDLLVAVNGSSNAALVLLIAILVMRGLWSVLHQMESTALMCQFMASLDHATAKKILDYYSSAAVALEELEDEDADRNAILNTDDAGNSGMPSSPLGAASPCSPSRSPAFPAYSPHDRPMPPPQSTRRFDSLVPAPRQALKAARLGGGGATPPARNALFLGEQDALENIPERVESGDSIVALGLGKAPVNRLLQLRQPSGGKGSWVGEGDVFGVGGVVRGSIGERAGIAVGREKVLVMPLTELNLEKLKSSKGPKELSRKSEEDRKCETTTEEEVDVEVEVVRVDRGDGPRSAGQQQRAMPGEEASAGEQEETEDAHSIDQNRWPGEEIDGSGEEPVGLQAGLQAEHVLVPRPREALEGGGSAAGEDAERAADPREVELDGEIEPAEEEEEEAVKRKGAGKGEGGGGEEGSEASSAAGGGAGAGAGAERVRRSKWTAGSFRRSAGRRQGLTWARALGSFRESERGSGAGSFSAREGARGSFKAAMLPSLLKTSSRRAMHPAAASPPPASPPARRVSMMVPETEPQPERVAATPAPEGSEPEFSNESFVRKLTRGEEAPAYGVQCQAEALAGELKGALEQRRRWYLKTPAWVFLFAVLGMLSLLSSVYSTRDFHDLIDLAPVVKEAGRRLMLVKAGAFLARELVLDDGFSRMTQQELSDGLRFVIDEIRAADRALRLGDPSKGVKAGADERNEAHNLVMYGPTCPWTEAAWVAQHRTQGGGVEDEVRATEEAREAEEEEEAEELRGEEGGARRGGGGTAAAERGGEQCADPAKPSVGRAGLLAVLVAYEDALTSVLHRYGVAADAQRGEKLMTYTDDIKELEGTLHTQARYQVRLRTERAALLEEDADVKYVLEAFDGYLADGLLYVNELLDHELDVILQHAVELNEILYAFFLVATVVLFWCVLFRRAVKHAEGEATAARSLIQRLPLHVLTQPEVDIIAEYFTTDEDNEQEGDEASYFPDQDIQPPSPPSADNFSARA